MSKLLVVFGATGQQGGSVIEYVLNDAELAKEYKIRAITRDTSKPGARSLRDKGVEVVSGDLAKTETLRPALRGAHTVFAMTSPFEGLSREQECEQGKAIADSAVSEGVQFFIWSTLPSIAKISHNVFTQVTHFEAKADVEAYTRGLSIKSAFFAPGFFMQNFQAIIAPRPVGDGTYQLSNVLKPTTQVPLLDVVGDTGKFIGAILAAPDKFQGQVLRAATKLYSMEQIARIMSQATGKTVIYKQIPEETMRNALPPGHAAELVEMMMYYREYGYYGPGTEEMVENTAKQARGSLTTFEEYLGQHPLKLP
ncbi:uncharacterized protein Z520_05538 [Fonsecaea multimorphosa CBS 102226]|uniref:NmrA-like domain-containing protein n=1 Tax=Fonsecaea multimorphosa CBS 102226 TaxID=1442371 RepID=A0A0D2JZW6_9EURO|nr:uncharacterized protein Z520_05538 [Fonsecaea multimorphosa CBS 102226]KIX99077.1 hypothetical protein Z520_05538 [Fonsecaea multimorphosa CBS 102226]OAL25340.1 hypothetical protein AYO22_05217 [Fonsecaea multimorphosa]